jgi:hypothetical protein
MELYPNEQILADVGANMFRGIEAVGGRMKITDKRIIFEPHAVNLQKMVAEIPLSQVTDVTPHNTLMIVPNGILVRLKSGVKYKFVVRGRERLIDIIRQHMNT